jgi:hypothetical protein
MAARPAPPVGHGEGPARKQRWKGLVGGVDVPFVRRRRNTRNKPFDGYGAPPRTGGAVDTRVRISGGEMGRTGHQRHQRRESDGGRRSPSSAPASSPRPDPPRCSGRSHRCAHCRSSPPWSAGASAETVAAHIPRIAPNRTGIPMPLHALASTVGGATPPRCHAVFACAVQAAPAARAPRSRAGPGRTAGGRRHPVQRRRRLLRAPSGTPPSGAVVAADRESALKGRDPCPSGPGCSGEQGTGHDDPSERHDRVHSHGESARMSRHTGPSASATSAALTGLP